MKIYDVSYKLSVMLKQEKIVWLDKCQSSRKNFETKSNYG